MIARRVLGFLAGISLVLQLGSLGGCATFKPVVERPQLAFEGLGVRGLSFNHATFVVRFKVLNPNRFGIEFDQMNYTLHLNDQPIGTGAVLEKVRVEGKEEQVVQLPIQIKYTDLTQALRGMAMAKAPSQFKLEGLVKAHSKEIPFKEEGEFVIPSLITQLIGQLKASQPNARNP